MSQKAKARSQHNFLRSRGGPNPIFKLSFLFESHGKCVRSWLNLVERWFGEITRKRIRRGIFKSVKKLIEAIQSYIKINNEKPKPFVWTKRVEDILEKVNHCKASTVQHTSSFISSGFSTRILLPRLPLPYLRTHA